MMLMPVLIFAAVMLLPVKWAADFTDASHTSVPVCAIASILGPVVAIVSFRLLQGGFNGFVVGYFALVGTYAAILRVPGRSLFRFAIVVLALQIASGLALISFGANIGNLLLGR